MADIGNIGAVLFDMDGTLVDSEPMTGPVIRAFCREHGIADADYQWTEFYGVTWQQVARRIATDHLQNADIIDMAAELHRIWLRMCKENPPVPVPGAIEAVRKAHARLPTAIVSSAYRESIDLTVDQLGLADYVTCRVGAEDYAKSKPAPDGFLHAAAALHTAPQSCLVFEDSRAGLQAARAARMKVIAITHRSNVAARASQLADRAIRDFTMLEDGFFDTIGRCPRSKSNRQ
ncbi:MAG: HAD family phosphatase [Gammaproteobacteria bacterium]|nr:HAD family phosphatase [Gammaproteobacteria bacterium]